jgi:hypothetical protein
MMEKVQFIANVIIEVMKDDPAKIIEAQDDAQFMVEAGATFGCKRSELMAEYALSMFKSVNTVAFPELTTLTDDDETAVENIIAAHIEQAGW